MKLSVGRTKAEQVSPTKCTQSKSALFIKRKKKLVESVIKKETNSLSLSCVYILLTGLTNISLLRQCGFTKTVALLCSVRSIRERDREESEKVIKEFQRKIKDFGRTRTKKEVF